MTFEEIKNRLRFYSVGICGAGGLGSNCAVALARCGIGKLVIADFDTVSESNLNRQYYFYDQIGLIKVFALKENIEKINPDVRIEVHNCKLNSSNLPNIYAHCDVIIEAFDKAEEKEMLIETCLSEFPGRPLVSGIGMAGFGGSNSIQMKRSDALYICGDGISEVSDENPPLAPRVGIVANMQANTVLEILLNDFNM